MDISRLGNWRRWGLVLVCALPLLWTACSGDSGTTTSSSTGSGSTDASASGAPAGASISVPLEVPSALSSTGLDGKQLTVAPGFGIRLWASMQGARFMARAPNGDVLVSVPSQGKIMLLRPGSGVPQSFTFASGLKNPHDMVFHVITDTVWLYFAESNRVSRVPWVPGQVAMGTPTVVVDGLPDAATPGLGGAYGHELKNIAVSPDDKLYVSIASSCNACADDTTASPVRGAIYQYTAEGANGRLYARGVRNAEGLDILPGTNTLWAAVNNRDEIRVPVDQDVDGDGSSDLGKIVPSYVDKNPPDPLLQVRDGGNYGWPFCNIVPNVTMSQLSSLPDYDTNPGGSNFNCATVTPSTRAFPAHAAPLGMSFLHDTAVPQSIRRGLAVAQHGCWNCTALNVGFKVVFVPFDNVGNAGPEVDLITGFVTDPVARQVWGRPVDVIADAGGNLLVSDDMAGVIYQLYPK